MNDHPVPTEIILHKARHTLEVAFNNDERFQLPWEYLRVFSPSMEVRGRRGEDRVLVRNKQDVVLVRIEQIGNYAVKLYFDDGHNTGIYDWRYLYQLGLRQAETWADQLQRLEKEDE